MVRIKHGSIFLLYVFILISCATQEDNFPFPSPDKTYYEDEIYIGTENITGSRDMGRDWNLPDWLMAYLTGGIREVEKIDAYSGKYIFIAESRGVNLAALSKWADNFSVEYDFPMFAAARIEKRMNASNTMYPDDEYGAFYENLIKNAYSGRYHGIVKEDFYWIKIRTAGNDAILTEVYNFFVLISVDMDEMQNIVYDFYSQAIASSVASRSQAAAISRLRQIFFEGF